MTIEKPSWWPGECAYHRGCVYYGIEKLLPELTNQKGQHTLLVGFQSLKQSKQPKIFIVSGGLSCSDNKDGTSQNMRPRWVGIKQKDAKEAVNDLMEENIQLKRVYDGLKFGVFDSIRSHSNTGPLRVALRGADLRFSSRNSYLLRLDQLLVKPEYIIQRKK